MPDATHQRSNKPVGDLSLDLDNKWAYLRTHDDPRWESLPTYLPYVVPKILDILDELGLKITFFVVGQDVEVEENLESLKGLASAGHEVANHSFNHQPWLQRYSVAELTEEFERTEELLSRICNERPVGFRAPGYSLSGDVLELMCQRGYLYDCSTLPTYLGPAARAYYLLKSSFSREQREDRKDMFGSFSDGFRSLKPYYWKTAYGEMLEMPVSAVPVLRTPFHFSYLHYATQLVGSTVAKFYWRFALRMCRLARTQPSVLLHPLDFLGKDEVPELDFFPGMNLPGAQKREFVRQSLAYYAKHFRVLTMRERAAALTPLKDRLPRVERLPHRS